MMSCSVDAIHEDHDNHLYLKQIIVETLNKKIVNKNITIIITLNVFSLLCKKYLRTEPSCSASIFCKLL